MLCWLCLQDATDLVARLRAFHHTAQSQPDKKNLSQCGLDLINGKVGSRLFRATSVCSVSAAALRNTACTHGRFWALCTWHEQCSGCHLVVGSTLRVNVLAWSNLSWICCLQVVNNVEAGVLEPALSKTKMIQVCTRTDVAAEQ